LKARQRYSLSQRLLVGIVLVNLAVWLVVASLAIQDNMGDVHDLYDVQLSHTALAILRVADNHNDDPVAIVNDINANLIERIFSQWPDLPRRQDLSRPNAAAPTTEDKLIRAKNMIYGKSLRYQIWRNDGSLLWRSANAPDSPITAQLGFSDSGDSQGQMWRHYSLWDREHLFKVIVSEAHDLRDPLVNSVAASTSIPIALALPVLILLLWFSINKGLKPLITLSRQISTRKPDSLTLINASKTPRELHPIVLALNDLLRRMRETLEQERRFNDNAAHELRTPLAAIQAHLYAARNAQSDAERQTALDQVQRGVARSSRLVSQMLLLVRIDPQQALPDVAPVYLDEMAETVCAELAPLALQRGHTLELQCEPNLPPLMANADLLSVLLSNLVDNAIRYTPDSGRISIKVQQIDGVLQMSVSDDGPGIDADQRERVFNRFYRLTDQAQPGTGLGLAICSGIATLHQARISLAEGPNHRGLTASVTFSG